MVPAKLLLTRCNVPSLRGQWRARSHRRETCTIAQTITRRAFTFHWLSCSQWWHTSRARRCEQGSAYLFPVGDHNHSDQKETNPHNEFRGSVHTVFTFVFEPMFACLLAGTGKNALVPALTPGTLCAFPVNRVSTLLYVPLMPRMIIRTARASNMKPHGFTPLTRLSAKRPAARLPALPVTR